MSRLSEYKATRLHPSLGLNVTQPTILIGLSSWRIQFNPGVTTWLLDHFIRPHQHYWGSQYARLWFWLRSWRYPSKNRLLHLSQDVAAISSSISASTFGLGSPSAVAINSFGTRRIKGRISA